MICQNSDSDSLKQNPCDLVSFFYLDLLWENAIKRYIRHNPLKEASYMRVKTAIHCIVLNIFAKKNADAIGAFHLNYLDYFLQDGRINSEQIIFSLIYVKPRVLAI